LLPEETPENIRTLLHRCLEKDQDNRLDNIADATLKISDTLSKPLATSQPTISTKLQRVTMIVGAIVIVALSAVGVWLVMDKQAQPSPREIRLVVLPFDNLGPAAEGWFADMVRRRHEPRDHRPSFRCPRTGSHRTTECNRVQEEGDGHQRDCQRIGRGLYSRWHS